MHPVTFRFSADLLRRILDARQRSLRLVNLVERWARRVGRRLGVPVPRHHRSWAEAFAGPADRTSVRQFRLTARSRRATSIGSRGGFARHRDRLSPRRTAARR